MTHIWIRRLTRWYVHLFFRAEYIGIEHIPKNGPIIVAANHTSYHDPIVLMHGFHRSIRFMAKKELFHYALARWVLNKCHVIPVDRNGPVIRPVRRSISVLEDGGVFGIFPEGKRCNPNENVTPKKGVGFFAWKTKAPIIPVALIHIKTRIRQPVKIVVGPAIHVHDHWQTNDYQSISNHIMQTIYDLKQQHEKQHDYTIRKVSSV